MKAGACRLLLVIPLGLVGAIAMVTLRGLENDVYLQIGLTTTMGLAAKNAILMIEFAEAEVHKGKGILEAALNSARIRLRPILMTSCAFIFGVLPLALAHGAGANARIAIGTAVIGGMLTATVLAVFFIPLFFVLIRLTLKEQWEAARQEGRQGAGGSGMSRLPALMALAACWRQRCSPRPSQMARCPSRAVPLRPGLWAPGGADPDLCLSRRAGRSAPCRADRAGLGA
jgi:hypothetical protein